MALLWSRFQVREKLEKKRSVWNILWYPTGYARKENIFLVPQKKGQVLSQASYQINKETTEGTLKTVNFFPLSMGVIEYLVPAYALTWP